MVNPFNNTLMSTFALPLVWVAVRNANVLSDLSQSNSGFSTIATHAHDAVMPCT